MIINFFWNKIIFANALEKTEDAESNVLRSMAQNLIAMIDNEWIHESISRKTLPMKYNQLLQNIVNKSREASYAKKQEDE